MERRISYMTRKMAEWGRSPRKNQFRYDRLMLYKGILNKRIKEVVGWKY